MNEKLVTNLPLSRKLAAAFKGIKPTESEFKWIKVKTKGANFVLRVHDHGWDGAEEYPAYLSDELLERMPQFIDGNERGMLWIYKGILGQIIVEYRKIDLIDDAMIIGRKGKTLPEAAGEMTIWLIDNDYWT